MSRLSLLLVAVACVPTERETEQPAPASAASADAPTPTDRAAAPEPPPVAANSPAEPPPVAAEPPPTAVEPPPPPIQPADLDPRLVTLVRRVAENYPQWGRVDDTFRFAALDCSAPMEPKARLSESTDPQTHGAKLYFLYALDAESYGSHRSLIQAKLSGVTQAIVKESFAAERTDKRGDAQRDGIAYARGEARDLFIMLRPKKRVGATDEGWIYATVAADRRTVTSAGVVDSCAGCHREAPHGRLFGPPESLRPDAH
jgi:hypothetical protein